MTAKKFIRPAVIAVILMIIVGITGYLSVQKNKNEKTEPDVSQTASENTDTSSETEQNIVENGYSFFPDDVLPDGADPSQYTLPTKVCGIEFPYVINDTPFTVTRIAKYSGPFVEDMSGEYVDNCLAVIIQNNTDDIIMTGTLVFKVNSTDKAVFKVNTLAPGKSCVVLEQSRRPFSSSDILTYDKDDQQNYYYTRSPDEHSTFDVSDQIQVSGSNGDLTIRNRGSETYKNIRVLYKNFQEGIYLGGVTYMLEFTDVSPGSEMTQKSLHYDPQLTDIVTIDKQN